MAGLFVVTDLESFFQDGMALPFVWGQRDCALWACDWIKSARDVDPAAMLRGRYRNGKECIRLLRHEGGLPALAERLARAAKLDPVDPIDCRDGDVIVAALPGHPGFPHALGIWSGGLCVFKGEVGLTLIRKPPLAAWRVL